MEVSLGVDLALELLGLFSAIRSISSKNPVTCILWLIMVFMFFSCLILHMGYEFLGLVFLVVYIGAIAVLFLFVVMMLNIRVTEINSKYMLYFPISVIFILFFAVGLFSSILPNLSIYGEDLGSQWAYKLSAGHNIEVLGNCLYTYYYPLFLLSSLVLLVAMVGSITLTLQGENKDKNKILSSCLLHSFKSQLALKY